jgi:hypothetical protein
VQRRKVLESFDIHAKYKQANFYVGRRQPAQAKTYLMNPIEKRNRELERKS